MSSELRDLKALVGIDGGGHLDAFDLHFLTLKLVNSVAADL